MDPTFTIKATANLTDLNVHTIRAWERRYKALEPGRHKNGRRLYSQEDIRRLKLLSNLVQRGHAISSVAGLSSKMLETMCGPINDADSHGPVSSRNFEGASGMVLYQCLKALQNYDLVLINSELEAARLLFSAKDFVLQLALPLLGKVGDLVAGNQFSIGQEHALSAVMRSQLMQIFFNARNSIAVKSFTRKDLPQGKVAAIATPEGELHEFGCLSAAIIAAVHGFVPYYFGPNMPADALADSAKAIRADVVIVGVTEIPEDYRVLSDKAYAESLEDHLPSNTQIWWGGKAKLLPSFFVERPRQRLFPTLHDLDLALAIAQQH